ncbi:MAG: ferric reductase-like transmembrane domain-containing protein [Methylocystaceae bacterium]|nr:ferric reductase-like transmembrane domain-containing protein [Methylocystaceae bacterium]
MKNIKYIYVFLIVVISALWLTTDPFFNQTYSFFALRAAMVNYTGLIGITVMSVAMIIAIRPAQIETWVGGLDKSYRLHKWLGITGLVVSIAHYLWAQGPKWAVQLGLLARPERKHNGGRQALDTIEQFFRSMRHTAEGVGEWAFYVALVLMILALIKFFPYKYFFKTHRFIALAYLALVFHSFILINSAYWGTVTSVVMMPLLVGGTIGAFYSLFRKIGENRRHKGQVTGVTHFKDNNVLKISIHIVDQWPGHKEGQFAFLTLDPNEGPHPFTISSSWKNDGKLEFMIKGLGDYTGQLPSLLQTGAFVRVEGPYGQFDFKGEQDRQIWVAGGIGITPFVSRLQGLAREKTKQVVDLFYSTQSPDEGFIETIRAYAKDAGVTLHLIRTPEDGLLDAQQIKKQVPDWDKSSVWFCGPKGFGQALKKDFTKNGLDSSRFHQELFEMR